MTPPRGAAFLLSALVLAACGSGAERTADPTLEVEEADLAIMVLPAEEIGPLADGLRLAADASGPATNARAARRSLDPEDTAKTMKGAGRLAGYDLGYTNRRLIAGKRGEGVMSVGTSVDLLRDSADASRFLNKAIDDFERLRKAIPGVRISGIRSFAPGVGHEAYGLRARVRAAGFDERLTIVGFRRGRLVGSVAIERIGKVDDEAEATRLAAELDERIQQVLAGELDGEPVALPGNREAEPDPKPRTLRLADLPPGLTVAQEGYHERGGYRTFARAFALRDERLGGSTVLFLQATTQALDSTDAAIAFVRAAGARKGSLRLHRSLIEEGLGVPAKALAVEQLEVGAEDAAASLATFKAPKAELAVVLLLVRSGGFVGGIAAIGPAGELRPQDVLALAPKLRERLAAG